MPAVTFIPNHMYTYIASNTANQHLRGMSVQTNKSELSFSGSQKGGVRGLRRLAMPLHRFNLWVLLCGRRGLSRTFWPQALHLGPVLISTSPACSSRREMTGGGASTTQTSSFTFKMSNSITFFWCGRHKRCGLRHQLKEFCIYRRFSEIVFLKKPHKRTEEIRIGQ